MLGMDQGQRSNAVGFNTAYLPDGEGSRHGGGTYTGQATEPTIQDYENFFGPSARDIKTDLQRFKRHGRWHLPDILQGPNPWLTDRIDGLITDATNSPFTTKILPYRFKEEVDGKIKWNVWSFDEGMASRVPYESAARTLTQSKRSFAGYMVRQGMAIVLEHNFMMTPTGRENFKNQLNQLIGSIQYTNDLDVHMALILAPSYHKTQQERYYTSDKSPAQVCREFADLFGMMQKNVNALDILIEEGKAILRTWGSPMPDFLLCNSKLTFQMTMTPEKTNYITQGIDGVKRLRQGPDLGSYRGLSVVHSRSFAMETGQHPRDVLRRRVRTAEYYRILPSKKNVNREFEFYNEERDTWFTLTFHDLLKYARHNHAGESDNAALVDGIYHRLSAGAAVVGGVQLGLQTLGARYLVINSSVPALLQNIINDIGTSLLGNNPLNFSLLVRSVDIRTGSKTSWYHRGFTDNMGITVLQLKDNAVSEEIDNLPKNPIISAELVKTMAGLGPMNQRMFESLYMTLKGRPLRDPFSYDGSIAAPGTGEWFTAYAFYLEIFQRGGLPCAYVQDAAGAVNFAGLRALTFRAVPLPVDYALQYLGQGVVVGSVNHPYHLTPPNAFIVGNSGLILIKHGVRLGQLLARKALLTVEVLAPLLARYEMSGKIMTGLEAISIILQNAPAADDSLGNIQSLLPAYNGSNPLQYSAVFSRVMPVYFNSLLRPLRRIDADVSDGELLARSGVSTFPLLLTSQSHLFHNFAVMGNNPLKEVAALRKESHGHLNRNILEALFSNIIAIRAAMTAGPGDVHPWMLDLATQHPGVPGAIPGPPANPVMFLLDLVRDIVQVISSRLIDDPYDKVADFVNANPGMIPANCYWSTPFQMTLAVNTVVFSGPANPAYRAIPSIISDGRPPNAVVDWNLFFETSSPFPRESHVPGPADLAHVENVELVIVRPTIEHNMLGVIMGLGGDTLGNTLWGQTELSVYDDSMHGIWGMSYKYHERAIVFNEKNLIRMWDIAYDGYNGGKDDTYVDWLDEDDDNSKTGPRAFQQATLDVSKNYRGPSMMVMAFVHDRSKTGDDGRNVYDQHFRRNWPSPIVFYDTYQSRDGQQAQEALPIDYDNVQMVNVEDFRVFNNVLYEGPYASYKNMMPEFRTMHMSRKTAGQSSADSETATDCLAFQGSMRIKEGGAMIQEIQGSGHHGPDYVGIASVRAGKGQKVSGQAPAPYRLV
jgi:hypothetical protein